MKLLEIQSSARQQGSISRQLSREFVANWKNQHLTVEHRRRDVVKNTPAHVNELWTTANYCDPSKLTSEMISALAQSEDLIEELLWSDHILLGVPMYNFSVPSTLKAYIDNIVRINRTFTFNPQACSFQGLVKHTKALIITCSAGNFTPGTPLGAMNFCETYLRSLLNFIGIENINVVPVPNQFMSNEVRQREIETARTKLNNLATNW